MWVINYMILFLKCCLICFRMRFISGVINFIPLKVLTQGKSAVQYLREVFKLSGLDSNNIKSAQDYNWKDDGKIFFMGIPYLRDSDDYELLVDELYISLLQNPLYVDSLKKVGDKYILHAMGEVNKTETVFTRFEFEKELNCLKEYCIKYK